jgi:hypothetical protein
MHRRKRRILKSLVLGLAIAAFAAPTAQGEPRGPGNPIEAVPTQQSLSPDDRPFYRGSSVQVEKRIVSPDDRSFYRGSSVQVEKRIVSPDDRSFYRGEAPTQVVTRIVSPDDRPLYRGVEAPSVLPISVTVSSESDDFQWVDAGLGAASTLAFVLALGGAALMIRHQRRRIAAF